MTANRTLSDVGNVSSDLTEETEPVRPVSVIVAHQSSSGCPGCPKAPSRLAWLFVFVVGFPSYFGNILRQYIGAQISTIEKQFGFSSAKSGSFRAAFSLGYLSLVVPISHFGSVSNRPRILGISFLVVSLAGIFASLPHFVLKPRNPDTRQFNTQTTLSHGSSFLCKNSSEGSQIHDNGTETVSRCGPGDEEDASSTTAYAILLAAFLLMGWGYSPKNSLAYSYVDDNVQKKHSTGTLTGSIAFMALLGSMTAFTAGGQFNRLYVNLYDPGFGPNDSRWIGAWWLGFMVFGLFGALSAVPVLFFPKAFPSTKEDKRIGKIPVKKSTLGILTDLLPALDRLWRNPVFLSIIAFRVVYSLGLWGQITFTSKYIQEHFGQPAWRSSFYYGISSIFMANTGMLLGGLLCSKLRLSTLGILKLIVICKIVSTSCSVALLLLRCPQREFSGLEPRLLLATATDGPACRANCSCAGQEDYPVCGSDGVEYLSPCLAGCSKYANQMCGHSGQGLGFGILGEFPSGPLFGLVIDRACLLWDRKCDGSGACALYDNRLLRLSFIGLITGLKAVSGMFAVIAYLFERRRIKPLANVEVTCVITSDSGDNCGEEIALTDPNTPLRAS